MSVRPRLNFDSVCGDEAVVETVAVSGMDGEAGVAASAEGSVVCDGILLNARRAGELEDLNGDVKHNINRACCVFIQ